MMIQTSRCSDLLGGGHPPQSNLWEDVQAMTALAHPDKLPLPSDQPPVA